eukprot:TRINITY_DN1455_c0_g1_i1.p1 TRINITY_DN1455_c0_g1~~TRINITY_DN1455_c0_g1_i1.p1  ORF type:complete len:206 (+),score=30.80 TRINITY_DN1455_c0_g1_i1:66-620(+)
MPSYRVQQDEGYFARLLRFGTELRQTVLSIVLVAGMAVFTGGWIQGLAERGFSAPQAVHATALTLGVGSVGWTCMTAFTHEEERSRCALNGNIAWLLATLASFGMAIGVNMSYIDHCPERVLNTTDEGGLHECGGMAHVEKQFVGAGVASGALLLLSVIAMGQARGLAALRDLQGRTNQMVQGS